MLFKQAPDLRDSEVTDHTLYLNRRHFIALGAGTGLAATAGLAAGLIPGLAGAAALDDKPTSKNHILTYNNFYELGTGKEDPSRNAGQFPPLRPWTVTVDGECHKPGVLDLDDLLRPHTPEERIYRMRCVEAWSLVIPWLGIPLADVLKRFEPTGSAKFVSFASIHAPDKLPYQRTNILPWPYVEGLRLDEAMHPLTLLATGLYGEALPVQNGAPLRLVVPWKYGFKGGKSIVRISFTRTRPPNTWNLLQPAEYGFYANVNPAVDHPRWSQARERRLGEFSRRPTLPFNGYAEQVAGLYAGMDLAKEF